MRHRPRHLRTDQRGVRPAGRAGHCPLDFRRSPGRRRAGCLRRWRGAHRRRPLSRCLPGERPRLPSGVIPGVADRRPEACFGGGGMTAAAIARFSRNSLNPVYGRRHSRRMRRCSAWTRRRRPRRSTARTRRYRCRPTGRSVTALNTIAIATALYHRFLERIVARVPVTALLQRGYTVRDNFREYTDES